MNIPNILHHLLSNVKTGKPNKTECFIDILWQSGNAKSLVMLIFSLNYKRIAEKV